MPSGFENNENRLLEDAIRNAFRKRGASGVLGQTKFSPYVSPVADVNPYPAQFCQTVEFAAATGSGSTTTIFTTPSDRDFFLNSIAVAFSKDATCDVASGAFNVTITVNGQSEFIMRVPITTLTAERDSLVISFPRPVKLDRNTAITLGASTFTAGSFSRSAGITGFTAEN